MAKAAASPAANQPATMVLASTDGLLRVEFRWHRDRYQHFFFAGPTPAQGATPNGEAGPESPLGESVEGDAENDWPPSPPIQQLSAETIDGENVLLGVGAAGQCHWSISVERQTLDDVSMLKFDLACRCKASPQGLGSLYQIDPQLTLEPLDSAMLEDCRQHIAIRPAITRPPTFRWSYLVRQSKQESGFNR